MVGANRYTKKANICWFTRLSTALFLSLTIAHAANSQTVNCAEDVTLSGLAIEVSPNGRDDTLNLQCAFDEARRLDARLIRLDRGIFHLTDTVTAVDFRGNVEGFSRTATIIDLDDGAFRCNNDRRIGDEFPAVNGAFKFVLGTPGVRFLTIQSENPCSSTGGFAYLMFTSDAANCGQRTFLGFVDRVNFEGSARQVAIENSDFRAGVAALASSNCGAQRPTGTLKVNRSEFTNMEIGVITSMVGGAEVDVTFNTFLDNFLPIYIGDANQNTSIVGNIFDMGAAGFLTDGDTAQIGISVFDGSVNAPDVNRTIIHNNRFFDRGASDISVHIVVSSLAVRPRHGVVITNNIVELSGSGSGAILINDTDSGVVQSNTFRGNGASGVQINREEYADQVSGWTLVDNDFSDLSTSDSNIRFSGGTSNNIVGPGQSASVSSGSGNSILN